MRKYVCSICGFVYDEAVGIPEAGIAPGTRWEELPDSWVCPLCGATKAEFVEQGAKARPASDPSNGMASDEADETLREMSAGELSALCSNLAKGCEKQYKHEEAELFHVLADYYEAKSAPRHAQVFSDLFAFDRTGSVKRVPQCERVSKANADRGALRALTGVVRRLRGF
jgi:rubredoxin